MPDAAPSAGSLGRTDAANIANQEKMVPADYIREDGFHITDAFRTYCLPLIQGEDYPPFRDGMPDYVRLKNAPVTKKLNTSFEV